MPAELDALRRRLYEPDVTPDEVQRYRALLQLTPSSPAAEPEPDPRPSRTRWRLLLAVGVAAAVAVGTVALAATPRPVQHPVAIPSAAPTSVRTPPLDDPVLALPASVRASFAAALRAGRSAGVLRYLAAHPEEVPAGVPAEARAAPQEHDGHGSALVSLTPSAAAQHGGRLIVAITVDRTAAVTLQVLRADSGMQSFFERLDGGSPATPGLPVVRTIVYDGEAPTIVQLAVPKGLHWDLVTVFTR